MNRILLLAYTFIALNSNGFTNLVYYYLRNDDDIFDSKLKLESNTTADHSSITDHGNFADCAIFHSNNYLIKLSKKFSSLDTGIPWKLEIAENAL